MTKTKMKKKTPTTTMMVIISKSSSVELLIWRNSLLVLDLGIDIVDGARCLDVQGDGLVCEHLDEGFLGGDIDDEDEDVDKDEDDI